MALLEVTLRSLAALVVLFLMTKLLGKRQITQLSMFEYIVGITIGNLAAHISLEIGEAWYLGIASLVVWSGVTFLVEYLSLKSKRFRDVVDGKGRVIIKEGKILEDNLKKERLTIDELLKQLRNKNVFRAADVEFAVMETSGELNVLLKREHQPITPRHLGIKVGPEQAPQTVIMDGKIMNEPLAEIGLNRQWLMTELEKIGVTLENVFLGQVDSYGQLYVDLYDDKIQVPEPQTKAALFAVLKKCEADLEMFGLSTENKEAKKMYERNAQILEETIDELRPLLTQ